MGKLQWNCIGGIGCLRYARGRKDFRLGTTESERSIGVTEEELRELVRKIRYEGFSFGLEITPVVEGPTI